MAGPQFNSSLARHPLSSLKGVGPKVAEKLQKLELFSVQDLLLHLPLRYEDRTRVYRIADLFPGNHATIIGEVEDCQIQFGRRRMMLVRLSDGSGSITLRFFTFSANQKAQLQTGRMLRCYGEIKRGPRGLEIIHPEYRLQDDNQVVELQDHLTPIYPTTEGVKQITLRKLAEQALDYLKRHPMQELLPPGMYPHQLSMSDAILLLHQPPPDISMQQLEEGKHPAQQRLIIEELLAQHLSMLQMRHQSDQHQAIALPSSQDLKPQLLSRLPFSPTQAQNRVLQEIEQDLLKPQPMMRMVQGDVGSGKTLVAALAALSAIENGYQVALMAPTELLAEQHAVNLGSWLQPLGITQTWLAGKLKTKARGEALAQIENGDAALVIGTHALFQEQVVFKRLALVIIDEQHRFGVHQRLALREKGLNQGCYPHQLIMTATPIPRTLAMTAYADLDTSIIDELPPGRTPVTTVALPDTRRDEVIERVRNACHQQGKQAYWVCTLIEESEALQCQAAEDTAETLQAALPELKVGLVHGRMKPDEKQAIMQAFKSAELDLLVATTVIEVGVDVPNSSLMIIENPERLGLAQLHQLRGRVGRGSVASHCVLLYHAPLSQTATKRLGVLRDTNDGFKIAQHDLEIRGPGELLGTRQTGLAEFKIADLVRDAELVPQVQRLAHHLMQQYPSQANAIVERWLGHREKYGHA